MNMKIVDDITRFVFLADEPKEVDIIFIPGGSHPELGEYAADLYKKGFSKRIMPSGGVSVKTGKFNGVKSKKEIYTGEYSSDCEFLSDVLRINGVPNSSIIGEDKSGSTKENAYFSRKVVDEQGLTINNAIICCKSFHARRSLMCYQFAFPSVYFIVYPVPYFEGDTEISAENWYKTQSGVKRVLGEVQRYGNQFTEEFLNLPNRL